MISTKENQVAIVGGGFTGLAAAYELAKNGIKVMVLEAESQVGGLAAAFNVEGEKLDRFYHHWFTNDFEVMNLINELNLIDKVEINPTNTAVYYANKFFKLSTPWDLLKFKPLTLVDRIRLGLLTIRARHVKDWITLESKTAQEWLKELGGENVYRVVWEPLLKGKFGSYAENISAVWFWNKLKLRGGSRGNRGEETLLYYKGSFGALAEELALKISELGGCVELCTPVVKAKRACGGWQIETNKGLLYSDQIIFTTALPLVADMIEDWAPIQYISELRRIKYLGNVCLILELDRKLSNSYWLNVNDPNFPFVGVIEHTNFSSPTTYGGHHIVYLSKYLPHTDHLYSISADDYLIFSLTHLKKMFPAFDRSWVLAHHLWRSRWAQPVVELNYSKLIPGVSGPAPGMHVCSMAQIYPEDRGTNYAIRAGKRVAENVLTQLQIG